MLLALSLLALVVLFLFRRSVFRHNYIDGVYCERHHWLFGNWGEVRRNIMRIHDWKLEQARRASAQGKEIIQRSGPFLNVVELLSPRMVQYMLSDNFNNFEKGARFRDIFGDLLGKGIFNLDFEEWRTQRKIASHMFSAAKLNVFMLDSFKKHSQHLVDFLHLQREKQEQTRGDNTTYETAPDASNYPNSYFLDMQKACTNVTMSAICEIGFGINLETLQNEKPPPFVVAFEESQEAVVYRFFGPPTKFHIQRFFNFGPEKAIARGVPVMNEFIYSIIRTRRENASMYEDAGDLLSLFLAEGAKTGKAPTDVELRDVIMSFLLAGRDTTAALLSWFFLEVCYQPELDTKLLQEIENVCGKTTADDAAAGIDEHSLKQCVFLEAALLETMRLHPPVPADSKVCREDCVFPDGTRVPAGHMIAFAPYTMGRLASIWGPDVDEFKPERWLSDTENEDGSIRRTVVQKSQYAFPAFNAGFRLCLGKNMAIMEAKTIAIAVLRQFKIKLKPKHDPAYKINLVMFQKNGLPLEIFRRDEC